MAFPTGWTKLANLKVDHAKVSGSSNLTNFPVLLKDGVLPASVYSNIESDGRDLRFTTDAAGTVEIPFEIVTITPGSSLCEIWIKLPTVSYTEDTVFYVWGDNPSASAYAASDTYGSQNVWESSYKRVLHLQEAVNNTSSGYKDSTANAGHATGTSMALTEVDGKAGKAQDFDGSADYLTLSDSADIEQAAGTITFCFKPDATINSGLSRIYYLLDKGDTYLGVRITNTSGNQGKLDFILYDGSVHRVLTSQASWVANTWYKFFGTWGASGMKVLINETADGTDAHTGGYSNVSSAMRIAGNSGNTSTLWDGKIDEFRFSSTQKTLDWGITEYNNLFDPSTFVVSATITASFSESVSTSDSMTRTTAKTFAEAVSAADSVLRSITKGFVESVVGAITFNTSTGRVMSESVTTTDSVIRGTGKTFSESFSVSDSFSSYLVQFKVFTEAITITESMNRSITKVFSEAVSAIEAMARTVSKQWAEAVSVSDSLFVTIGMILAETVLVTVSMALVVAKAFTESVSIAVSLATLVILNFTESISSSISFNIGVVVSFVESLHITDTLTRWKNGIKILWEFFYTQRGTSYTNKHSSRGTTWTKKY